MKDSYWFRHDSSASRDIKLMKIRHIYDFWGIGLYWSVIELLREQPEYRFESNESGIDLVCSLVYCSNNIRFNNWFKDCLKLDLFKNIDGYFYSQSLCDRMKSWETKKNNGSKGGRPIENDETETITETITEIKPNDKANENHKIIEDNIIKDSYQYSFFYDLEIKNNESKQEYKSYSLCVAFLFGNNDINKPLSNWLKLEVQLSYKQYEKLVIKARKLNKKISDMLMSGYNTPKYVKGTKSIYLVLNNWLNRK